MEFQGISDINEGFFQPQASNLSMEVGKEKIDSLKKSISEIQKLIEERTQLSENFLKEGDEIKLEISNFLIENENSTREVTEKDFIAEKNSLRNKKIEISEHQLNEKINCWKDIALLKKEQRTCEQELTEKESRMQMLNKLIEEK